MTIIQAIEQAIQHLPARELAEFYRWFTKLDETAWEVRIDGPGVDGMA